jgi:hypothetical protein
MLICVGSKEQLVTEICRPLEMTSWVNYGQFIIIFCVPHVQLKLNEMTNRETEKRLSRCSVDSGAPLSGRSLHSIGGVVRVGGGGEGRVGGESEVFFSVKSFPTSRAATVGGLPMTARGGRLGCVPNTPADSWKWRKRSSGSDLAASQAPAYNHNSQDHC